MNGIVTITASFHRHMHLLPSISFLKPTILMALPGNQVMLGRASFHGSPTQDTGRSAHGFIF